MNMSSTTQSLVGSLPYFDNTVRLVISLAMDAGIYVHVHVHASNYTQATYMYILQVSE